MKDNEIYYICNECAESRGWKWPTGHCGTSHYANCDVCGEHKSLTRWNDWLINGEQKVWD